MGMAVVIVYLIVTLIFGMALDYKLGIPTVKASQRSFIYFLALLWCPVLIIYIAVTVFEVIINIITYPFRTVVEWLWERQD